MASAGNDHVEAVDRQAAVPVHAPARQLEVREQVVAEIGGRPHVSAHVAAGRRRLVEHEVAARRERVQVDDHHHDDRGGDQHRRRDEHPDHPLVGPRPLPPGDRAPHDPPRRPSVPRRSRPAAPNPRRAPCHRPRPQPRRPGRRGRTSRSHHPRQATPVPSGHHSSRHPRSNASTIMAADLPDASSVVVPFTVSLTRPVRARSG